MSAFVIELAALNQGRSRVEARADASDLDLPQATWPEGVGAVLDVERSGDKVALVGRLSALARL